ncbi:MAG: tRNA(fMet)-specific endonuclease VapC [Alphaproteobacteria bacterium]
MLRYMLDTNICIYVLKNRPPEIRELFNLRVEHLCLSPVSVAELLFGAETSQQPERNLAVVENFTARLTIPPFDEQAAGHYGNIRADLEAQGQTIGPYDLMIAGHARSRGLVLVTNNRREFDRVSGLRVENWLDQ